MTRRPLGLLLRLLLALPLAVAATSAASELRVEGDTLFLDGEIKREDYATFSGLLAAQPEVTRLSIKSPGGDLATGLRMGDLVRGRKLTTVVEGGVREAASAAAYLFMGGTERIVKGDRGVGVHAFYTSQAELRKMIKQKSGEELLQTLTEFERRTQESTMAVVEYTIRMLGDSRIVAAAVTTGSDAMLWPDTKALLAMKVATRKVELAPEEIPDLDWTHGEVIGSLAERLDAGHPDGLDERERALLDGYLADSAQFDRLRGELETLLARIRPANREAARQRLVQPMVESIVRQVRATARAVAEAEAEAEAARRDREAGER